jgi:2-oxoglutarate dehydrogenase E2 component (dihydrolipoamide succinyltransferase)
MPQLGESVIEGTVGKWLKSEGARVERYEPLLEVITDKVDSEITSPDAGLILQIYVQEGETVQAGRLLATIGERGDAIPAPGSPEALEIVAPHGSERAPGIPALPEPAPTVKRATVDGTRISPVVARIAAEHHVDLSEVTGTGRGGRISKKDIVRYVEVRDATKPREQIAGEFFHTPGDKASTDAGEETPLPAAEPGDLLALTPMRKAIAKHMVHSARTSPHVSTVFEVDASHLVAHRTAHAADYARKGVKLTFTPYFVQAAVQALRAVPVVNSTFTDKGIQLKSEINIGIAVAIDEGLIVPVIKNADEKSLLGTARELDDLAQRARKKQLKPDEVQGGTFTITNHGLGGSLVALPIINQPQAAILAVGMIQKRVVVVEDDAIAVRPMVYLSLTFDHRILDGAVADRFMMDLKQTLEGWMPEDA